MSKLFKYECKGTIKSAAIALATIIAMCTLFPLFIAILVGEMHNYVNIMMTFTAVMLAIAGAIYFFFFGFSGMGTGLTRHMKMGASRRRAAGYVLVRTAAFAGVSTLALYLVFLGAKYFDLKSAVEVEAVDMINSFMLAINSPFAPLSFGLVMLLCGILGALMYLLCVWSRKVGGVLYFVGILAFLYISRNEAASTAVGQFFGGAYTALVNGSAILPLLCICAVGSIALMYFIRKVSI